MEKSLDTTKLIGRVVSMYYVVTGIGFMLSGNYYADMVSSTGTDPVLINLSGMVHFFIGMTILVIHFKWKSILQSFVTLLGFAFLLKGVFLIALPELTLQSDTSTEVGWATIAGFIAVGIILGYYSFLHNRGKSNGDMNAEK